VLALQPAPLQVPRSGAARALFCAHAVPACPSRTGAEAGACDARRLCVCLFVCFCSFVRVSPALGVQVAYMGSHDTMGAEYIAYFPTDRTASPPEFAGPFPPHASGVSQSSNCPVAAWISSALE
jgi:hypothetical protein